MPSNTSECALYVRTSIFTALYEGIPETLLFNVFAWLFLLLLFTFMRQQAWDYGRLALVNNNGSKKRWTQLFYAKLNANVELTTATQNTPHQDQGLFSWIIITLKLKKDQILMHSGPDAVHYLSFQQHLMVVMAIITLISLGIILPINIQGTLYGDVNSFGHTTLSNLDENSPWLWFHVITAIVYVPLVVLVMRRSSGRNAFKMAPTKTIMIKNIAPVDRSKQNVREFIQQLFPDINIHDIQLAYNIEKLTEKNAEYEKVIDARHFCESNRDRDDILARPKFFSCKTVNALEYYQTEETKLAGQVARLRAAALNEPLDIAFVTLTTLLEAQNIIAHFRPVAGKDWNITFAPSPFDLFWENLNVGPKRWYLKWAIVNIILFLVLFFLTTPAIIVNLLNSLKFSKDSDASILNFSPLISEFLPTLMLWTLSALMPVLVAFSDKWLSHWTRSLQNYSIMTKTFGYLLFMILILPSLGLASAEALVEWSFNSTNSSRWTCVFLPDKGAFFVNYIITASFIGTALELLRFPELIQYTWFLITAKSKAETLSIRKSILVEFPFGVHYAWTVMVFTMSVVYSIACPLIMPFAMTYICFKHFGDRHNLYFAYGPSNMISRNGGKIHSTAVTMTKFSVVMLLIIMIAMIAVRNGGRLEGKSIVLLLALCITLTLFSFMSPIKRCTMRRPSIPDVNVPSPPYVAEVLLNKQIITNNDSPGLSGYGTDTRSEANLGRSESSDSIQT